MFAFFASIGLVGTIAIFLATLIINIILFVLAFSFKTLKTGVKIVFGIVGTIVTLFFACPLLFILLGIAVF